MYVHAHTSVRTLDGELGLPIAGLDKVQILTCLITNVFGDMIYVHNMHVNHSMDSMIRWAS